MPRDVRLRRAAALLLGAVVAALLLLGDRPRLEFFYVPLVLGLAYLAAAVAGGPKGGLWSTALPLTGWGLGVVLGVEDVLPYYDPALFLLGAGVGALVCAGLERRGFAVDLLGVAGTLVLGGLLFAVEREWSPAGEARTYVVLLAGVGLWNLLAGLRR